MAVTDRKTAYPFAEVFEVTSNGTTAVEICTLPANTIVTGVIVLIKTAATVTGNLIIGDASDDDGYISAQDGTAAAGTIYGDTPSERGAYLYDSTVKGGYWKLLVTATAVNLDMSDAPTVEGVYEVTIFGYSYAN